MATKKQQINPTGPARTALFLDGPLCRTCLPGSCQGTRFEALLILAVTSGMSEGKLLGLRWRDITWTPAAAGPLCNAALQQQVGVRGAKSAKSRRTIVLNSLAV